MSEVGKTAAHAMIYAVGVILERAASFVMLPIYTSYLSPKDYGTIELLMMTTDVFALVAGLGISMGIFRFYYQKEDALWRREVVSTAVTLLLGFYLAAGLVGWALSSRLAGLVLGPGETNTYYFQLSFVSFFLQSFVLLPLVFIRAQQKPKLFVAVSVFKLVMQLTLNVVLIVFLDYRVLGVIYSAIITSFTVGLGLVVYTYKEVGFRFTRSTARALLVYGAPFLFANLGDFVLTFSDRYFLTVYTDLSTVGVYSLGYKIGFVLWAIAAQPINNTWGPRRFEIAEHDDAGQINKKIFLLYNFVLISVGLWFSLFSLDLFRIMSNSEFHAAYKIVPLVVTAYLIQAWTSFGNFGIHYSGHTKYIAIATVTSAMFIIAASFLLIPRFGGYGAATATILAFGVRFVMIWIKAQSFYRLELPWGRVALMICAAGGAYLLSRLLGHHDIIVSVAINGGCFGVYLALLYALPVFAPREKEMVLRFLRNPVASARSFAK